MLSALFCLTWTVFIGGVVFAVSQKFVDSFLSLKWIFLGAGLILILLHYIGRLLLCRSQMTDSVMDLRSIQTSICVVLSAQAMYGILQYYGILPATSEFRVSGSYDNPAGFAAVLCPGLPFVMSGMLCENKCLRWLHIIGTCLLLFAIILSQSRSALFAVFAVFGLGGFRFVTSCTVVSKDGFGIGKTFHMG